jgi:hypothetical protein
VEALARMNGSYWYNNENTFATAASVTLLISGTHSGRPSESFKYAGLRCALSVREEEWHIARKVYEPVWLRRLDQVKRAYAYGLVSV